MDGCGRIKLRNENFEIEPTQWASEDEHTGERINCGTKTRVDTCPFFKLDTLSETQSSLH